MVILSPKERGLCGQDPLGLDSTAVHICGGVGAGLPALPSLIRGGRLPGGDSRQRSQMALCLIKW